MRLAGASPPAPLGGVVQSRRIRELALIALAGLLPLVLGLAISVSISKPSVPMLLGLFAGGLAIVFLFTTRRLEVAVMILLLYLGLLEGPVKLGSGSGNAASAVRDVLIGAVALGALLRLSAVRERVKIPPLSGWVIAFVALVLAEAFNPKTAGISKVLGGYRQQLEWVPFFFFGYALIRSRERFRRLFLVVGVVALANGIVGTYQAGLGTEQLASWGPGYRELVFGGENGTGVRGRVFASEGEAQVRPPALGSDAGFGGGVAVVALPATLALLVAGGFRRRWPVLLLTFGGLAAVATGLGRLQVVGAVLSMVIFAALAFSVGGRVNRSLGVLLGVIVLAIPVGAVFVSAVGGKTFNRYSSIAPGQLSTQSKDTKITDLETIPKQIERAPFGVGLGRVGAAAGFGGIVKEEGLEKHGLSSETQYNFVVDELGLPGLLLWAALTIRLLLLMTPGLRTVEDPEVRIYLAALTATLIAFTLIGFSGPTMSSASFGPFFWGTAGIASYWFLRARRGGAPRPRMRPGKTAA
jgi:hypothetical protein